jgi:hypothetical protein
MEATLLVVGNNSAEQSHRNLSSIRPGWVFLFAHSYDQAKNLVQHTVPDAAVVESNLPQGSRLIDELAYRNPNIQLFVTASSISDKYRSGVHHDGLGYTLLERPYSLGGLVNKIEQTVAPARSGCELCLRPRNQALALYRPLTLPLPEASAGQA